MLLSRFWVHGVRWQAPDVQELPRWHTGWWAGAVSSEFVGLPGICIALLRDGKVYVGGWLAGLDPGQGYLDR